MPVPGRPHLMVMIKVVAVELRIRADWRRPASGCPSCGRRRPSRDRPGSCPSGGTAARRRRCRPGPAPARRGRAKEQAPVTATTATDRLAFQRAVHWSTHGQADRVCNPRAKSRGVESPFRDWETLAAATAAGTVRNHAHLPLRCCWACSAGRRRPRRGAAARHRLGPQARRAGRGAARARAVPRLRLRLERRPAAPAAHRLERFQALPAEPTACTRSISSTTTNSNTSRAPTTCARDLALGRHHRGRLSGDRLGAVRRWRRAQGHPPGDRSAPRPPQRHHRRRPAQARGRLSARRPHGVALRHRGGARLQVAAAGRRRERRRRRCSSSRPASGPTPRGRRSSCA